MKLKSFLFCMSVLILCASFAPKVEAPKAVVVLQVFVLDESGNVQPNTMVKLFKTEADFLAGKGVVASEKTNKKGKAVFKGLDEKRYFILAKRGKKDNTGGAYTTKGKLDKNRVNKINIIISSGPTLPGF